MIDVTYQQTGNDMFADVRIFSFTLILSVEFLMMVGEFFSDPAAKNASTTPVARKTKSSTTVGKILLGSLYSISIFNVSSKIV